MATVTDTKPTKTPLVHRVSTTSKKSMAENVKKIAITTDNNHRQRNTMRTSGVLVGLVSVTVAILSSSRGL
jgi:hypothetical protein